MENTKKPKVKLVGKDGNVFNLIGICQAALRKAGQPENAKEMAEKIYASNSYDAALGIMCEYCDVY
jgi:hypothetical protein